MTFRQMELFIAVCECNSIKKTSALYHISQQGVSKMIRQLEEELGCQLLDRNVDGVSPTQYGEYFLDECRIILGRKEYITSHISQIKITPKESIFLGMAFGVVSAISYKMITDFEYLHPNITINYEDRTDYYLEERLKKDKYDFCLTTGVVDNEIFSKEHLFREHIYLCIPRTHKLYLKTNISMKDLSTQRFAMFSKQFHIRHNFVASCQRAGFEPNIVITSSDFNSLKEISQNNNLLFVVPAHTVRTEDSLLRYYRFPDDDYNWDIYFVKKKEKALTENMVDFYEHVKGFLPTSCS